MPCCVLLVRCAVLCCVPQEVWQLLQEFQALISSYVMKYQPPDAAEWRSVIQEVRSSWALQYSTVRTQLCSTVLYGADPRELA